MHAPENLKDKNLLLTENCTSKSHKHYHNWEYINISNISSKPYYYKLQLVEWEETLLPHIINCMDWAKRHYSTCVLMYNTNALLAQINGTGVLMYNTSALHNTNKLD
jgi:hypothetical protein